jgi:PhnB protein
VTHQIRQVVPELEAVENDFAATGVEMSLRLGQGVLLVVVSEKYRTYSDLLYSVTGMSTSTPATGRHTTNGMPHGSTSLTPHVVVTPAEKAMEFYHDVFGARIVDTTRLPGSGLVAHAVLDFGTGMLTLSDPMEAYGLVAGDPGLGATFSLALYVPDVDEVTATAQARGATVREPATTFVSGDRFASVLDPFGLRWSIMTRVEDISPEVSARRVAAWAASKQA